VEVDSPDWGGEPARRNERRGDAVDFRKDPTFLFFELGLCPKDNGAKKRTDSNSPKNGFGV
jgi:hypothetical protein